MLSRLLFAERGQEAVHNLLPSRSIGRKVHSHESAVLVRSSHQRQCELIRHRGIHRYKSFFGIWCLRGWDSSCYLITPHPPNFILPIFCPLFCTYHWSEHCGCGQMRFAFALFPCKPPEIFLFFSTSCSSKFIDSLWWFHPFLRMYSRMIVKIGLNFSCKFKFLLAKQWIQHMSIYSVFGFYAILIKTQPLDLKGCIFTHFSFVRILMDHRLFSERLLKRSSQRLQLQPLLLIHIVNLCIFNIPFFIKLSLLMRMFFSS